MVEDDKLVLCHALAKGQKISRLQFAVRIKGADADMPNFTSHIFICTNRRSRENCRGCCDPDGNEALRTRFKTELKKRNLGPAVRANRAGCLDQCEAGPTVVIYPQQIWYGHVTCEDVSRIIDRTVIGGEILQDLLIDEDIS